MVGFDAWQQTPPAIERQIPRPNPNNDWWGDKTGGTRNGNTIETRHEDEVVSNTLTIRGETRPSRKIATENRDVKAEFQSREPQKQHTTAFSEFLFHRKTVELVNLLNRLKQNLQNPEGAAIMTLFRSSIEQIWHVAGTLPRE